MGICWYCYWGWSQQVMDIYSRAVTDLDGYESALHFGPAHIVWEDENFDSAEWCLENFEKYAGDLTAKEAIIVRRSLEELAKIPLEIRCCEPEDYDGKHPENFPPPADIRMIK